MVLLMGFELECESERMIEMLADLGETVTELENQKNIKWGFLLQISKEKDCALEVLFLLVMVQWLVSPSSRKRLEVLVMKL